MPDGFRAHATTFERAEASSLLLGRGVNLIRLGLDTPGPIALQVKAGEGRLRLPLESSLTIQLSFDEERKAAIRLTADAERAERDGSAGAAIAAWSELLDRYPFDVQLVTRAQETRSQLIQAGHERVDELRREFERATFFQLADLFREGRAQASETSERFGGTEVEAAARQLIGEIDVALAGLHADEHGQESERLTRDRRPELMEE